MPTINDQEREMWIMNDEHLYNWWRSRHQSVRTFIRENRDALTIYIRDILDREPSR